MITAPEIEMLIIFTEDEYVGFKKSGKKPSEYCIQNLHMHNVKNYEWVKEYFADPEVFLNAIREYRRVSHIPEGEYCLSDLLK